MTTLLIIIAVLIFVALVTFIYILLMAIGQANAVEEQIMREFEKNLAFEQDESEFITKLANELKQINDEQHSIS